MTTDSVTVLYFAGARDAAGAEEEQLPVGESLTVARLLEQIFLRHPALAPHREHLRVAVNREFARDEDRVWPGDEIALIPPVAGG
jgi:molybdopterin converting factor subunit 1